MQCIIEHEKPIASVMSRIGFGFGFGFGLSFYLIRRVLDGSAADELLDAACDLEEAVIINVGAITSVEPAICIRQMRSSGR